MVFSGILFLFVFLAANLCSQILIKSAPRKNVAMLIFSLVFYSWAGPKYLLLLLLMSLISWGSALGIEARPASRKGILIADIASCLLILGFFKYTGFFLENIKLLTGFPELIPDIALPIGISFYTFQLISYVVDVYRGEVAAQKKYWMVLLYASLFHQCIAGPIVRYQDVESDLLSRKTKTSEVAEGISRFTVGLAKKAVLANACAGVADSFFDLPLDRLSELPVLGAWLGAVFFTLQIYLDFSAYSDMAIGMGLMCGLHYKENFNYPYISDSVADFWRRWHISLSSFFRDYVYIPLGGNRCSRGRQIFNIFVVWALTGLWHGASWNFVLWGLYFGVLLCLERFVFKGLFPQRKVPVSEDFSRQLADSEAGESASARQAPSADERDEQKGLPLAIRHIVVLFIVIVSWVIFKFTDADLMVTALKGLFGLNGAGLTDFATVLALKNNIFLLVFCCIASTPLGKYLKKRLYGIAYKGVEGKPPLQGEVPPKAAEGFLTTLLAIWEIAHPPLLLILSAMALAGESYNPFLYFRF